MHEIYGESASHKIQTTKKAMKDVEATILVTIWKRFEKSQAMLREARAQPVVTDGRPMLDKNPIMNHMEIGLQTV